MEKPLHVQVAEALGCKPVFETYTVGADDSPMGSEVCGPIWRCLCPKPEEVPPGKWDETWNHEKLPAKPRHIGLKAAGLAVARYDESWFSLGPWIERLGIDIGLDRPGLWSAAICQPDKDLVEAYGHSPLVAVCKLILDLKAAGKLEL